MMARMAILFPEAMTLELHDFTSMTIEHMGASIANPLSAPANSSNSTTSAETAMRGNE